MLGLEGESEATSDKDGVMLESLDWMATFFEKRSPHVREFAKHCIEHLQSPALFRLNLF